MNRYMQTARAHVKYSNTIVLLLVRALISSTIQNCIHREYRCGITVNTFPRMQYASPTHKCDHTYTVWSMNFYRHCHVIWYTYRFDVSNPIRGITTRCTRTCIHLSYSRELNASLNPIPRPTLACMLASCTNPAWMVHLASTPLFSVVTNGCACAVLCCVWVVSAQQQQGYQTVFVY